MEFLAEYGLFLLKVMTIVVAIVIILTAGAAAGRKATQDHLEVENLNDKYRKMAGALRSAVMKKDERKKQAKQDKKQKKAEDKQRRTTRSSCDSRITAASCTSTGSPRRSSRVFATGTYRWWSASTRSRPVAVT